MKDGPQPNQRLKTCPTFPNHIWMAEIPFCPYCNISPEARAWYAQQEQQRERKEKQQRTRPAKK